MNIIDKVYYYIYCFATYRKSGKYESMENGYADAKKLFPLAIFFYLLDFADYFRVFSRLTNVRRDEFILAIVFIVIFILLNIYTYKKEKVIVEHYTVLRKGQEKADWWRGFIVFIGAFILFFQRIS